MRSRNRKQNMAKLIHNSYGKVTVRLTKVQRTPAQHNLFEFNVDVSLTGDFEPAYTQGDNRKVIATDSIKNTVYVLAARNEIKSPEQFALLLGEHFCKTYAHVNSATVTITQDLFSRVPTKTGEHPHAFVASGIEKRYCVATVTPSEKKIIAGLYDLEVLKTTDSAWKDFLSDEYRTLPDTDDRIMASRVKATWQFNKPAPDFDGTYTAVRNAIINAFATHKSLGVQQTEFVMADDALKAAADISQITIEMPNRHRVPFNLKPFNLENKNEVFVTTSEPAGYITATVTRD